MYLANSLWTHKGTQLKQAYVGSMESLFQATAREATNGAKDINAWVAGATRGMIKDLIMTDDFIAVLANAIYFKGLWKHAFKSESTHTRDFTTSSGEVKQVSMMQQLFKPPGNAITGVQKKGLYDAVSLPYKGDAFSAVALLPAEGVDMSTALKDWAAGPQKFTPLRDVKLIMPKFKVATAISLKPVLQSLGVESAFSPGAADFSRMVDFGAFVSDVVHKAVVEVDEEGTVAAAATGVVMMRCLPAPPEEIIFNRPFAFMIYHNPTDLPAFIGVINDPSAA
ncbi:hypothetical protein Vretimale_12536 [Volvox reticuliferus]|nr:hypothetical protein Vretimale_12536 [Volvox reticuliferus]